MERVSVDNSLLLMWNWIHGDCGCASGLATLQVTPFARTDCITSAVPADGLIGIPLRPYDRGWQGNIFNPMILCVDMLISEYNPRVFGSHRLK